MKVLLFDMHDDGHHLEYASRLQSKLEKLMPDDEFEILLLHNRERHDQYFDHGDIQYLYSDKEDVPDTNAEGALEYALESIKRPREKIIKELFETVQDSEYDILHLLHLDDVVKEVYKFGPLSNTKVVGTINGAYFKFQSGPTKSIEQSTKKWGIDGISKYIPAPISRTGPWSGLNIHHAVRDGVIDEIFVPTEAGRQYIIDSIRPNRISAPIIPDPVDPWFDESTSKEDARGILDINSDDFVILFFGGMRHEKGADILIEALEKYQGRPITAIFAGKPVSVNPEELRVENSLVNLQADLEFISDAKVPLYFLATDAVVLPYRRSFGEFRPSGVFQKACGALRPVIAPRFGMFEKRTTEWDLGVTFEPESSDSLAASIEKVGRDPTSVYDEEKMKEYASSQTYEKLAEITGSTYENLLETNGPSNSLPDR